MIALLDTGGWVKLHRGLLLSPVWQNSIAYRVYSSMYLRTAHKERMEPANTVPVKVLAGQLLTSQAEICELTGYTRKAVRSALEFLVQRNAVTVCGQCGKAGTVYAVHSFPFMEREESVVSSWRELGPKTGPRETGPRGLVKNRENHQCHNEFSFSGVVTGAGSTPLSGPEFGPEEGPVLINKDGEVEKIRNNPLPPFEKGADGYSDSISFILRMWREACESARMPYIEDKKTLRGAEAIARELLVTGKADAAAIREGMKNLLAMKKTEAKAKLYNLGTLCRGLSNFVTNESTGHGGNQYSTAETVYEWFTLHCPVCRTKHIRKLPVNRPDKPVPETMPCPTKDCSGNTTVREGTL